MAFVYHRDYASSIGPVPLDPERATEILAFLLDRGLIDRADVSEPDPVSLDDLLLVHTPAYLETLERPETMTAIFGAPLAEGEAQDVVERQRLVVGGTVRAARLALGGHRIVAHLAGGFHHAAPGRGMGFCVFNDVAVAIRVLRAGGFTEPILVVDLDLHDGNGTRAAFADDPTVWTFSIHNAPWDDGPAIASTSVALGSAVTDDAYLDALRRELPPVVAAHRPRLVFYVAGTDVAADDRLGNWKLTPDGILARDAFVAGVVRGTPLVILLGGGYGAGAWRHSARFFAWQLAGRRIDPPDDMSLVLGRFRPVAREFATPARAAAGAPAESEWGLTAEDLDILAPGAARETRVLG
ncbi:MAG: histone deacetylase family protein, partial [Acidimicrobiales bacterium]